MLKTTARLLPFEFNLQLRQVGFWITFGVMILAGLLLASTDFVQVTGGAGEKVKANGAVQLALQISAASMVSLFFGAIYVVSGLMRDQTSKMLEVIHATPVPTTAMTLSRMTGVVAANFLAQFGFVIGLLSGTQMPWIDKEILGPINLLYYLQPTLLFLLLNAFIVSAFFTLIAATTRNRTLVYVSAIGLFVLYMAANLFVGQDTPDTVVALVDPFGANALALETRYWPAAEQNTRMIPVLGLVGLNRMVWGLVGLVFMVLSFKLFKRGLAAGKTKGAGTLSSDPRASVRVDTRPVPLSTGQFQPLLTRAKMELMTVLTSIPFLVLTALAVALFGLTLFVSTSFVPTPTLPTNASIASQVLGSAIIPLMIMIVFFGSELMWRERSSKTVEMIESTPVSNATLLGGKYLALAGLILVILFVAMVVGMIAQLIMGGVALNPWTHFQLTILRQAPRLLLFGALVLFLQNLMPNRIVGMLASGAVLIFFMFFVALLPFYHPLMGYGSVSMGGFSEMNGFNRLNRFKWFGTYWAGLAAFLTVASAWLWRRGVQTGFGTRIKDVKNRISPVSLGVGIAALVAFVGSGAGIFNAYNIRNDFRTSKAIEREMAAFETRFSKELKAPLPKIRSTNVRVDFYPEQTRATASGTMRLENVTGAPLEQLFINLPDRRPETVEKLTLSGATQVTKGETADYIADKGIALFAFDPPLAVGGKTELEFALNTPADELGDSSPVYNNGTFLNSWAMLPTIGLPDQRIQNPDKRRKNDLPELERKPDRDDMEARNVNFISKYADYVDFSATVCTTDGQIPIAPGTLVKSFEEDGRACRSYRPPRPILNFFAFVSARYDIAEDVWTGPDGEEIPLEIYYHKPHDYNVQLMLDALKDGLSTFTEVFGPYQFDQIRIMEFPYGNFAQSFAGTIPFSENIGFVMKPGDPDDPKSIDQATYVTMHELGHQWFAHQIVPADVKGFNVLSEGLTEYAALEAYQQKMGWAKTRRLVERRAVQDYLIQRALDNDDEPPLALAGNQQYLVYNKAMMVFWGLKHYIGEEPLRVAVRGFLQEYGQKGPPYPTTKELVEAIREQAGPDYQQLVTDYWEHITFWDLKFKPDTLAMTPEGDKWRVSFTALVDKKYADEETGKETSVTELEGEALNEWIEIGFYSEDPKSAVSDDWQRLERVKITQAETELSFLLDDKPGYVLLDPRMLLIERIQTDNSEEVKAD